MSQTRGTKRAGEGKMWIIQYIDWEGTMEELEKWDKEVEKACEKTEGVKYKGRWGPHNKKYHWAYFFKAESFNHWMEMGPKLPRDYSKVSHLVMDYFSQ